MYKFHCYFRGGGGAEKQFPGKDVAFRSAKSNHGNRKYMGVSRVGNMSKAS